MDEAHLATALPYVALNPVRARLCVGAEAWPWSSVRAQLGLVADDGLTDTAPVRTRFPDFAAHLSAPAEEAALLALRRAESTGRPIGGPEFLGFAETACGRTLAPAKRGLRSGRGTSKEIN